MSFGDVFNTIGSGLTLGSSIASLFGSNNNVNNVSNNSNSAINTANLPYKGPIVTPGYTFSGGVLAPRDNSYGQANQDLSKLYGNQLGGLNAFSTQNLAPLSARLAPGYGQLTQAMVGAAQSKGQQAYGNLRDQLAQRNILGASFADNQLAQQQSQNTQDENLARANAFQQEMQSTLGLNQQQMDVLAQQLANANAQAGQVNQVAAQKLNELGLPLGFLRTVLQTGTPAAEAYKAAALQQSLGGPGGVTNTGADYGVPDNLKGVNYGGATGGSGGSGGFAGLPTPGPSDKKWTAAYKQFLANNDVAGYTAYLKQRGAI
jgi:hypothetical protein